MAIVPQSPTLLDGTVRENREKSCPVAGFDIYLEWAACFTIALCAELLDCDTSACVESCDL